MKQKILIVEDQFIVANSIKKILARAGYRLLPIASRVQDALDGIDRERPDLVLVDIYLKGGRTGVQLALELNLRRIPFVYISANSDPEVFSTARATCPSGFLVKPFREKDLLVTIDIAWYSHQHRSQLFEESQKPAPVEVSPRQPVKKAIVGDSEAMRETLSNIRIVAPTDTSVLILGESGTGKELIANSIHQLSARRGKPFLVVDCGTLPANLVESELFGHEKGSFTGASEKRVGKLEQADGGTVFLDEVGELSLDMQVKFLRFLQEMEINSIGGKRKTINVRVVAATNRDLEAEVIAGRFRMDLYYRLNVFPLFVPPLRDRGADIIALAEFFLHRYATLQHKSITGITPEAKQVLSSYHWPGNVRELENAMARAVLLCSGNEIADIKVPRLRLAEPKQEPGDGVKTISQNERDHILLVLAKCNGKVYGPGGAAELLDIHASTLKSRMKKLGIGRKYSY
jgi:DNA-binding NtrC family response regulator